MSDWDVHLISAGSLPMQGALLGPAGTFADTEICSNVVLLRGGGRTILIDTAAGQLDSEWEGATSNLEDALAAHSCAPRETSTQSSSPTSTSTTAAVRRTCRRERIVVTATAAGWARASGRPKHRQVLEAVAGRVDEVEGRRRGRTRACGLVEAPGPPRRPRVRRDRRRRDAEGVPRRRDPPPKPRRAPGVGRRVRHGPGNGPRDAAAGGSARLAGTGVLCAASRLDGWGTFEPAGDGTAGSRPADARPRGRPGRRGPRADRLDAPGGRRGRPDRGGRGVRARRPCLALLQRPARLRTPRCSGRRGRSTCTAPTASTGA